jgi:hypothetical protein
MTNEAYLSKAENLKALESLLEHPGYSIFKKAIEDKRDEGANQACDVNLSQAKRDAGAGRKTMGDELLGFVALLTRSLETTLGQEKAVRSRKRQSQ